MLSQDVIAIDLAKNVLQICHISIHGELVFNKAVSRKKATEILAKAKPSIVAMEGCCDCQYWGQVAQKYGHDARIYNPKKVKGSLEGHKTDHNDALAIANTALRIGIKFSRPKTVEQQAFQSLETTRRFMTRTLVSIGLHLRSTLFSYGFVSARGERGLAAIVQELYNEQSTIPVSLRTILQTLWEQYKDLKKKIADFEKEKNAVTRQIEPCKRLMKIEGVGETTASMLYATLGDGKEFKNGRQAAAFVGVTPKQHSSGGKVFMIGIDKRGGVKDLRTLLYLGAMNTIRWLPEQPRTQKEAWIKRLLERIGFKKTCIALANKIVRTAWAMLVNGTEYKAAPLAIAVNNT